VSSESLISKKGEIMSKRKISISELLEKLKTYGISVVKLDPGSEIGFTHISKPSKLLTKLPEKSIPDVLEAVSRRNEIITHYLEIRRKHREELAQRKLEAGK